MLAVFERADVGGGEGEETMPDPWCPSNLEGANWRRFSLETPISRLASTNSPLRRVAFPGKCPSYTKFLVPGCEEETRKRVTPNNGPFAPFAVNAVNPTVDLFESEYRFAEYESGVRGVV